ncbi:DUF2029 domain-containing protein [Candidatus Microgenomates bacterium]|jgi:Gpi18-like mannosyltransferase|nr:MAG: DUF2029 domain-containing protein [Candidatus Microgenomates bacterium]
MSNFKIKLSLFGAFLLRIAFFPWGRHSDCDNFFYWSKYLWDKKDFLGFLGKSVPNAMPATYPPIYYYLIYLWRGFYELIGEILWRLNVKLSFFPSNFIFIYQSYQGGVAFNKLPAIFADFGCAFLIFKTAVLAGCKREAAAVSSLLFLLLPPFWYNSAHWGQIDSIYAFFILLAFYLTFKSKFLLATFSLGLSALVKPTGLFVLPAFLIYFLGKRKIMDGIFGAAFFAILAYILYFPIQPLNTLAWAFSFYFGSFKGEVDFLASNAFNFWSFLFGFDQRPAGSLFLGIPLSLWGFAVFTFFGGVIAFYQWKRNNRKSFLFSAFLFSFASFLFLPRMHERYFYTAAAVLAILSGFNKKMLYLFVALSLIHFINLYHFWWSPRIPLLISLFSNLAVLRVLIFLKMAIFAKLLLAHAKNETA